jgi:chromosome segregation ATPase
MTVAVMSILARHTSWNADLSGRIDQTNTRIDETNRRIVESEIRTDTAITELAGSVRDVATLLREQHDLRPRLERCENEIAELKRRVPAA